ncbi:MAG: ATP-dependent DNA helicase RecG [Candidatus Kerfeldbacteria bacterium]|nr:ATP-dependent DNA helicase RecG [Candidatus Kerfeldbacteria bacterium]
MPSLMTLIKSLPRMNPMVAQKLASLGLITLEDALFYFPFRHQDFRQRVKIADVTAGQEVTILGTVTHVASRRAWRRRSTTITDVTLADDTRATIHAVWFNLPFLSKALKIGDQLYVSGKIAATKSHQLQFQNPVYEKATDRPLHEQLIPVYRSTEGLSQRQIRLVMKQAVSLAGFIHDQVPEVTLQDSHLMEKTEALKQIHFPDAPELAHRAVRRLAFDELVAWQVEWQRATVTLLADEATVLPMPQDKIRSFVQSLPFELTNDQRIAAWQIMQDLAKPRSMYRLLQGEVGSGKTVVAALAADDALVNGYQVALIAPTLVLAEQHWQTLTSMFSAAGVTIGFLAAGSCRLGSATTGKATLLAALASQECQLLVGTHAVLQPQVELPRLGLVIIDEQQRFGVTQRQSILERQRRAGRPVPHFLSLSATPIPRTLALWLTGNLSISQLTHKPAGRGTIITKVVGPSDRAVIDQSIAAEVAAGHQAFVITPLIEESDALGIRSVTTEYERLRRFDPDRRLAMLHGALEPEKRVSVLTAMRQGLIDVLVSTTVIEVGVDIPNATLMVIEGAERFGVAQLHQLRGRIGRDRHDGLCLLATDHISEPIMARLNLVASTNDGLALAAYDLQQRGAGDMYGVRQSGLPDWQLADFAHPELMAQAEKTARDLLARNPKLEPKDIWPTAQNTRSPHRE